MIKINEADIENFAIDLLEQQGYTHLASKQQGRASLAEVVLHPRLKATINKLNPDIPVSAREQALREVLNLSRQSLIESNWAFHTMLTDGVRVEYQQNSNTRGGTVWL